MFKKKLVNTTLIIGLSSSFVFSGVNVHAESLQSQKAAITQERSNIQSKISDAEMKIVEAQEELVQLNKQIEKVDKAIEDNQKLIEETKEKITVTNQEIAKLEAEITELKERIEKRNEILKERARSFQENGGNVNYLDVLLGSASFKDFVDRIGAVATIMEADQDIIEKNEADKKDLETKQNTVETKLAKLTDMKSELEGMQAQILEQQKKNDELKKELKEKEAKNKEAKAQLLAKDSSLASKEADIKAAIEAKKKAELEAMVAETTKATEAISTSNSKSDSDSSSSSSSSKSNDSVSIKDSSSTASGSKAAAITAGYKYIGNSVYVFGGGRTASDVANGRFDCSGFVHWAYAQAGYSIGSSTDSLKNSGTRVSTSDMQPGDLVFFDTYKTDGHVGIYVGGGKFIGSQSSTGVAIVSMTSGYWKEKFNGRVVRI